ncbi:hypothetical protein BDV26DRAFT_183705 [Aspergillus bertholletiae]|uniref:Uncharacterized protein n=1 Tax=Aspergillus bertholletiae TaxID=1226010 RepID=A0A5N7BAM0_9EURO|nr:hypothetical protein BDV26DRAFT_183705 [Aspergillus bertholletiae]
MCGSSASFGGGFHQSILVNHPPGGKVKRKQTTLLRQTPPDLTSFLPQRRLHLLKSEVFFFYYLIYFYFLHLFYFIYLIFFSGSLNLIVSYHTGPFLVFIFPPLDLSR